MKNNNKAKKSVRTMRYRTNQYYRTGKYCKDDYDMDNIRESVEALTGNGIKLHNTGIGCYR